MTESCVFYQSFHNAAKNMSDAQYGRYMKALCDYAFNDILPDFDEQEQSIEKMCFEFVKPQVDANKERKRNGFRGGRPKQVETTPAPAKPDPKAEEKPKAKRFEKPTVEQVRQYCTERNNGINPQHFVDYYESRGWKIGNNSMKDWKAAVRTWESRANNPPAGSGGGLPADRLLL